jgi:hypothetical protein
MAKLPDMTDAQRRSLDSALRYIQMAVTETKSAMEAFVESDPEHVELVSLIDDLSLVEARAWDILHGGPRLSLGR